jgi:hypothetical protein
MRAREQLAPRGQFQFRVRDRSRLIVGAHYAGSPTTYESEWFKNLVVDAGRTYMSGNSLIAVTQITTWYLGLMASGGSVVAGDTMGSHAGWTELTGYVEATREAWVGVAGGTAGTVTNTASPGEFTIDTGSQTIGGLFLTSGSATGGSTGTLFAAGVATPLALPNPSSIFCTYDFAW